MSKAMIKIDHVIRFRQAVRAYWQGPEGEATYARECEDLLEELGADGYEAMRCAYNEQCCQHVGRQAEGEFYQ